MNRISQIATGLLLACGICSISNIARAQDVVPCDQNGNELTNLTLQGPPYPFQWVNEYMIIKNAGYDPSAISYIDGLGWSDPFGPTITEMERTLSSSALAYNWTNTGGGDEFWVQPNGNTSIPLIGGVMAAHDFENQMFFKWTGSGAPPKTLNFLVSESPGVSYILPYGPDPMPEGCSASGTVKTSFGETRSGGWGPGNPSSGSAGGQTLNHLVTAACGSKGIYEVFIKVNSNSKAYNGVTSQIPYTNPPEVIVDAEAGMTQTPTVQKDNRKVSISANVDPTNYALQIGSDHYGDPIVIVEAHERGTDGTMYGDIGLPYNYPDETEAPPYLVTTPITYTASFSGPWTEVMTDWTSSLKNYDSGNWNYDPGTKPLPTLINDYDDPNIWQASIPDVIDPNEADLTKPDNIKLTATDETSYGDVSMTAHYTMTLHQPYEFAKSRRADDVVLWPLSCTYGNPTTCGPGGTVECIWDAPSAVWGYLDGALTLISYYPVKEPEWLTPFVKYLAWGITQLTPKPCSQYATFEGCWANGTGYSTWDGQPAPNPNYPSAAYQMTPGLLGVYDRKYSLKRTYDAKGFEGQQCVFSGIYKGPAFYGEFKLVN